MPLEIAADWDVNRAHVVDTAFAQKLSCIFVWGRKLGHVLVSELFFVRDSSTGGSNTETGEEFVEVAGNMVSSKVPGQSSIHSGS